MDGSTSLADAVVCEPHPWKPWTIASFWAGDNCKLGLSHVCSTCTAVDLWPECKVERAWIRRCPSCDAFEYWRASGVEAPDPSPAVRGWIMLNPRTDG
jgi:hypothetical protein